MDEEARCLVVTVAYRLDEGLGGVLCAWCRRHSHPYDFTPSQVEDDEGV